MKKNDPPTFSCPLCHSSLKSEDYYQAIEDLQKKVSEKYKEDYKKATKDFEKKLDELNKSQIKEVSELKERIHQEDVAHKAALETIKDTLELKNQAVQKEKDEAFKKRYEEMKKFYEGQNKEIQNTFKVIEEQVRAQCKKELTEKEQQLAELRKEQARVEAIAFDKGKADAQTEVIKLKNDIQERDIQIDRFRRDAEDLKKKLEQKQSELSGEVGEIDLYINLTEAFPNDSFERQTRGKSMGDIVQKIRTTSNTPLEMPIVYDNKRAESVTSKDIAKAKRYKEIHATDYVIIVSRNLPKKDIKNGLFGEKEGILLCHPSIVSDVVRQIRRAIIEINKQSGSKKDRERKESRLYEYVTSSDFNSTIEKLHDVYQKAADLQEHEEKAHEGLWKQRRKLQSDINEVYNEISTGVDCIVQEKLPMHELTDMGTDEKETKDTPLELTTEPLVKKKKRSLQIV